jgi:hypothetical protein
MEKNLSLIVLGFVGGTFYPAFMHRPRPDEKPMPKWLGSTIFAVVGVGLHTLRALGLPASLACVQSGVCDVG